MIPKILIFTKEEASGYLDSNRIQELFVELGVSSFHVRPEDLNSFLIRQLQMIKNQVPNRM